MSPIEGGQEAGGVVAEILQPSYFSLVAPSIFNDGNLEIGVAFDGYIVSSLVVVGLEGEKGFVGDIQHRLRRLGI